MSGVKKQTIWRKKVSVIIVNWNGKRFLERLLKSLDSQTYESTEVILIDNSSSDGSAEYVKDNFPKVKVIHSGNLGFGHACNIGVEKASGEYIILLNEDTYLPETFVEDMTVFYEKQRTKHEKIGAIGCKFVDFDKDPSKVPVTYGGQIDLFGFPINKYDKEDIFSLAGIPFFCEKKTYLDLGGYSEFIFLFGEEIELTWRARLFGYKLLVNPNTYLHHFGGGVTGGFSPKKVALMMVSSIVPALNCYSTPMLVLIMPLYFVYVSVGLVFLTIFKNFNLDIAKESFKRLFFIIRNIPGILKFRRFVQSKRVLSDYEMLKYISFVPSFIYNQWWFKLSKDSRYELK